MSLILLATTASPVMSQNIERYLPQSPRRDPHQGEKKLPKLPKEAQGATKILVEHLKGIMLVDHPERVVMGQLDTEGVRFHSDTGLEMLRGDGFEQIAAKYLGGPVSLRRLNQLVREMIILYRENDQPVVDISVPEQDITDGVVQIVVVEARVGEVRVEGPCFFDPCRLAQMVCISSGDTIYESVLLEDLRRLNRNPFRAADMYITPGKVFGETDIVFKVKDERPFKVYTGYEDTGSRAIGLERLLFGVHWGNAFWRDHQLGYQYTASLDFQRLQAHSVVYSIPLENDDTFTIFGSLAEIDTSAGFGNQSGLSWQVSARYNRSLCPINCFEHGLVLGVDFKQTNTDLEFGGTNVFASSADIFQMMAGYHGHRYDRLGATRVGADLFVSPGEFSKGNNDAAFQQIRAAAQAQYIYSRLFAEREIYLPNCYRFVARISGQIGDGNLLASEQLGFGGYHSVRGYDMRIVNGDAGYLLNLEIRSPIYSPGLAKCHCDEFQWLVFYDMGDSRNHTLAAGEDPSVDLSSVGFGIRYTLKPGWLLRFDYGQTISNLTPNDPRESRVHLGLIVSY